MGAAVFAVERGSRIVYFLLAGCYTVTLWAEITDRIETLRQLTDDWDGQGAEAPDKCVIDGAAKWAARLEARGHPVPDRVIAGVAGTIYFEWCSPLGHHELEVSTLAKATWRWVPHGATARTKCHHLDVCCEEEP